MLGRRIINPSRILTEVLEGVGGVERADNNAGSFGDASEWAH